LVSLDVMTQACRLLSTEVINEIIIATSNPFIGLFIGLLATAILQSSSTTTSMLVVMVAAGTLSIESAIPIILGANVGTTVTSSFVALAHITRKQEFRRAIGAAVVHDFFNWFTVLIVFPVQLMTGFFSELLVKLAHAISSLGLGVGHGGESLAFSGVLSGWVTGLFGENSFLLLVFSIFILFFSIKTFSNFLKSAVLGGFLQQLQEAAFGNKLKSLVTGTVFTALIQSSSVSTSIVVPLVATRKVSLKNAFPFVIGANIGTTVTALIAAISKSEIAIAVALVHVVFNLIGALVIFSIPFVRGFTVGLADQLGKITTENRFIGFLYIIITFFVLPFFLIYLSIY